MKVVVAPNSFKGSLSATQAARAIGRGVLQALPDAQIVEIPVADGGDGTVEALVTAHHGTFQWVEVEGPLGDPVRASYGLIDGGKTAVIELASASGFELIAEARRDPRATSTYGFGQLLAAARSAGVKKMVAGIGGSATNDAGAGMAQAIGYRLLDEMGADLPRGGAALVVQTAGLDEALKGADLVITGEGRIDAQTAFGKAPGEVARRAQAAGVRVLFLAGRRGPGWDSLDALGIREVATLDSEVEPGGGPDRQNLAGLMQNADQALTRAAARAVAEHRW